MYKIKKKIQRVLCVFLFYTMFFGEEVVTFQLRWILLIFYWVLVFNAIRFDKLFKSMCLFFFSLLFIDLNIIFYYLFEYNITFEKFHYIYI